MQGENDDCITWPIVGSVTFTVFNQREGILRYVVPPEAGISKNYSAINSNSGLPMQRYTQITSTKDPLLFSVAQGIF